MTIKDMFVVISENRNVIGWVLIIGSALIQIAPIKLNPWSAIVGLISRIFSKPLMDRLDKSEEKMKAVMSELSMIRADITKLAQDQELIKEDVSESAATSSRYRILRFDDELLHDIQHSQEHFKQILVDIDTYERFCLRHPDFPNGLAVSATKHIISVYEKCVADNNFL